MSMSWREAIECVLKDEGKPLHYAEISELILTREIYKTDGARPDTIVNTQITSSIRNEGDRSPFIRVGKGIFALRAVEVAAPVRTGKSATASGALKQKQPVEPHASIGEPEPDESVIRCLGMYWQRDLVVWRSDPRVFGKQQALSKPVDFSGQQGIYIL